MNMENPRSRIYKVQTGWINFSGGYMNFQRLRDVYLLATFTGLETLTMKLDYNFIDGHLAESIEFPLAGYSDSPRIFGGPVDGGSELRSKMEWRFQPRTQQCSAVRIEIIVCSHTVKFDSLRFGIDAGRAITGQQSQVAQR